MLAAELQAKQQARQELTQALGRPSEVLAEATTVFPLTLFPDTITLSRSQLTIAHRSFFRVAQTVSIRIEDVLDVVASVGPLFGSLRISTRFYDDREPYFVNWLWRADALRLKRVLQGYIISIKRNVDTTPLGTPELSNRLDELGAGTLDERY